MAVWTKAQNDAICESGCNLLVNAAAGSGKTAVLVERIIHKVIYDRVDIDSLLVVTFTNAAAAEMRERIGGALIKKIIENPFDEHLKKQMTLIGSADITTIDAFCLNTVRNNFHLLDVDPAFSIADSNEVSLYQDEAARELFERMYESRDADFLNLAGTYSVNRSDRPLKNIITGIYNFTASLAEPQRWMRDKADMFGGGAGADIWFASILSRAELFIDDCIERYNAALEHMQRLSGSGSPEDVSKLWGKYAECVVNEFGAFCKIKAGFEKGWNEVYSLIKDFSFGRVSGGRKLTGDDRAPVKAARDYAKDILSARVIPVISDTRENIEAFLKNRIYPTVNALVRMSTIFGEIFSEKKKKRGVLDFADVEHLCLSLLTGANGGPSDTALELRSRYSEILIDEYQDSNELQEAIFTKISNGRNMFMVGDMKQSIYRFRNTDPTLFKTKNRLFPTERGGENRKIVLSMNFRSSGAVIRSVNEVFESIMSEYIGEIDYDEEHMLNKGADIPERECDKSELFIIDTAIEEEDIPKIKDIEAEAVFAAKRIKELKESGYTVIDRQTGKPRPLENKDVAVLMRSVKTNGAVYARVLNEYGVSAFAQGTGYFSKTEVKIMLSLIKIINNPRQDIPLVGVMRSVIGGFDDNEIAMIYNRECGGIFESLAEYAKNKDELSEKCRAFLKKLGRWRGYAKFMPSDRLIWTLYEETDFYSFSGALAGGDERQANLRLLFERAKRFEASGFKGLFNFVSMLEKMIEGDSNMSPASVVGENHNVVRIMSIHKSKGLEFPVTIISGIGRKFYKTVPNDKVVLHKDLGFGMEYINPDEGYTYPTITKNAVRTQAELENLSEEMRMLYVAMTRARQKLIMIAALKNTDKKSEVWNKKSLTKSDILSAGSFLNWTAPVAQCSADWDFSVLKLSDVFSAPDSEISGTGVQDSDAVDVDKLFSFEYHFAEPVPSKVTVTEMKRINAAEDDGYNLFKTALTRVPAFIAGDVITPARAGTAMHFVMQNIPLTAKMSERGISAELENMVVSGMMARADADSVRPEKILAFFDSELGKRMIAAADTVRREVPFEIEIPANKAFERLGSQYDGEKILLQGMIDCFFEEEGGFVLVDYKTDYYRNKFEIEEKYKLQLDYYAEAMEKIFKKRVKNKYIYLFYNNDVILL